MYYNKYLCTISKQLLYYTTRKLGFVYRTHHNLRKKITAQFSITFFSLLIFLFFKKIFLALLFSKKHNCYLAQLLLTFSLSHFFFISFPFIILFLHSFFLITTHLYYILYPLFIKIYSIISTIMYNHKNKKYYGFVEIIFK